MSQSTLEPTLHIGCSTDDNYVHHACVMLCSLLENNPDDRIVVHLLHEKLTPKNQKAISHLVERYKAEIVFHRVDTTKLAGVKFRKKRPLSLAAYYRLLLSSLLPQTDKILYLDVDMVVLGKIKPLFELDIEPYGVAAVKDVVPCIDDHRRQLSIPSGHDYFCSALMLINLKYWREHDSEARLLEFAKRERKIFCHDQDALNYVFKNSWYQLPPKWNRFSGWLFPDRYFKTKQDKQEYYRSPAIIHFSAYNPADRKLFVPLETYYKKYLTLSGFQMAYKPIRIGQRIKSFPIALLRKLKFEYLRYKYSR